VLLGPDRDFLEVTQFVQGVLIEVRHGLVSRRVAGPPCFVR
jgi:hypothetical protein